MEGFEKRKELGKYIKRPDSPQKLWCGKIQALCSGNACRTCHLFPVRSVERRSILSQPSLTDHNKIGLIKRDEE